MKTITIFTILALLLCSCTKTVQAKVQEPVIEDTQQEAAELSEAQTENKEEQTEGTEEEPQDEVSEKQTELPEHLRPMGYDDPVLTKEAAKEILLEAREMQIRLFFGGLYEGVNTFPDESSLDFLHAESRYYYDFEKKDYECINVVVLYYIPEIGTFETFNKYFLRVFTEESLNIALGELTIIELNGRTASAATAYSGVIFERDWSKAEVLEVEQQEGSDVATVKALVHSSDSGIPIEMEYTLEFSEKYGWRVNLEDFHEGM